MWLKKLKKKKFQFALVAVMLCFTSAIFAACICFVAETGRFTADYTSWQNCPRVTALADARFDEAYFNGCAELMDATADIRFCDVTLLPGDIYFGKTQIKSHNNMAFHVSDISSFIHGLKMMSGTETAPGLGEVWVSSVRADSCGISVGDTLSIGASGTGASDGKTLTVSGIVATPLCPSSYMGNAPYYISEETAATLDGETVKGITFFSSRDMTSDEYIKLMPGEFMVEAISIIDSSSIDMSISYLADIFGGVGLLAAAVIFAVSLVIIKFIITSNLAREYREIGTYKALGFTERQIVGFYLKSFLVSGGAGIVVGAGASFLLAQYLCNMVLRHLGKFALSGLSAALAGAVAALLTMILLAGVLLSLKKVHCITPVEAFAAQSASSKKKTAHSLIKNAYTPLCVAINDIVRRKGTSLLNFVVLTVAFYMCIMFATVNSSLAKLDKMTGQWFAFPQYDCVIRLDAASDIEGFLKKSDSVKRFVLNNIGIDMTGMQSEADTDMNSVSMEIYDDCTEAALGLPLIEGRHPEAKDEILLSYDMAQAAHVGVGDWFRIWNESYSREYLVTGLFSSMYNSGRNIIMDGEEYGSFKRPDAYAEAIVFLREGVVYADFERELRAAVPDVSVAQTASFLEDSANSLNNVSQPLTTMFVIIFSLFSMLNIVNLLIMDNIENRRQYGILKAMGFTNRYLCAKNLLRILMLTLVSAGAALVIHFTLSQKIFFTVIHVNGLALDAPLAFGIAGMVFAAIVLITLGFTLPMGKVAPTELMEE